ncbi:heme ABC exporter ATP-binding protein CcmA [Bryobacter aggregatus]|uniref:heme ABC exporter ATP-binding protein CcmA n=1 Tax=Bryobacter aggregatus TaxID=360054 RepID=UPI0004E246C1|nr:heme ABC exporter ATP-binding protein CcmA [Bryobacter aggregatus]
MSVLKADRVSKFFGSFPALRDLTFALESGDCVALLGRNGAGKTTLLNLMAGLSRPTDGKLEITKRVSLLGHGIGVYDELSARENLKFFATLHTVAIDVDKWLYKVNLLNVADAPLREYSRGMRQRLALARVFMGDPELLLLDEPFTSLDDKATALLQTLLAEALARKATVVLSTHQIPEAMALASRIVFLENGKLAYFGPRPQEMLDDSTWIYRTYGASV